MMTKADLQSCLKSALEDLGGSAAIVASCRYIWKLHEDELRRSGDLFYTWQYDIRWAATMLRKAKVMKAAELSGPGLWELAGEAPPEHTRRKGQASLIL